MLVLFLLTAFRAQFINLNSYVNHFRIFHIKLEIYYGQLFIDSR